MEGVLMKCRGAIVAFSLVEVIIAVSLFAGAVTVIIALTGALLRQSADTAGMMTAQTLPESIKVELSRLAAAGFMATPLDDGFALVASRDGTRVQSLAWLLPAIGRIPSAEQYYLIECWRFPSEPLSFEAQKAFLALHVRVSWPYRIPGATGEVALADRNQVSFAVSLNR
jgi:hypothetical protein